jgi:pimeloyl-ACP methyl ester carboxylesterase
MKTVLFVPGYKEDLTSRDYKSTLAMIEKSGYKVKFVPIHWDRTTINDWVAELEEEYSKHNPKETILAGFSFGAMTAFVTATKQNPAELWLFSLSGYFDKDIKSKQMKKSWLNNLGHRRVAAFSKLDYEALASRITCRALLFAGQIEMDMWPTMKYRTNESPKYLTNAKLTIIDNVGHDVTDKTYIAAIKQLV